MELTSVDVYFLVRELQGIVSGKVEKILQSDTNKKDILFTFYVKDKPKQHLRFLLPGLLCMPEEKPQVYPKHPPGFVMFLRKYLKGTRLQKVEQLGFSRVVALTFATKEEERTLVVELLAPGNMILVVDGMVRNALETQSFKDRSIRARQEYVPPPSGMHLVEETAEKLEELLVKSEKNSVVTALAMDLSLGGVYAEEVCKRADVDKNAKTTQEIATKLVRVIKTMLEEELVVCKDEKRTYPILFTSKPVEETKTSFGNTLATFVKDDVRPETVKAEKKTRNKMQSMLEAQENRVEELGKTAVKNKEIGEKIFEQYQIVQEILQTIQENRKGDVQEALKKYSVVKKYHKKTGEVELEL